MKTVTLTLTLKQLAGLLVPPTTQGLEITIGAGAGVDDALARKLDDLQQAKEEHARIGVLLVDAHEELERIKIEGGVIAAMTQRLRPVLEANAVIENAERLTAQLDAHVAALRAEVAMTEPEFDAWVVELERINKGLVSTLGTEDLELAEIALSARVRALAELLVAPAGDNWITLVHTATADLCASVGVAFPSFEEMVRKQAADRAELDEQRNVVFGRGGWFGAAVPRRDEPPAGAGDLGIVLPSPGDEAVVGNPGPLDNRLADEVKF